MHYGKQVLIDCFLAIYLYLAACNPADVQIADDGMPFLAERNSYMPLSDDIRAATPFDHIAFDYQPCGHPPLGIFTKPHYDLHIYHVPVEAREHMTCDLLPGAPVCAFPADAQTSDSGKAFYDQIPTIAKNFAVGIDTAIPLSGIHYWNQDTQPASAAEWTEPFFIMGGVSQMLYCLGASYSNLISTASTKCACILYISFLTLTFLPLFLLSVRWLCRLLRAYDADRDGHWIRR